MGRWRLFGFPHTNPAVRQGFPAREPLHARIGPRAVRRVCKKERRKPLENSELIKTQFGAHLWGLVLGRTARFGEGPIDPDSVRIDGSTSPASVNPVPPPRRPPSRCRPTLPLTPEVCLALWGGSRFSSNPPQRCLFRRGGGYTGSVRAEVDRQRHRRGGWLSPSRVRSSCEATLRGKVIVQPQGGPLWVG